MTHDDFMAALAQLRLSKAQLGRMLGVRNDTVYKWRAAGGPPRYVASFLQLAIALQDRDAAAFSELVHRLGSDRHAR